VSPYKNPKRARHTRRLRAVACMPYVRNHLEDRKCRRDLCECCQRRILVHRHVGACSWCALQIRLQDRGTLVDGPPSRWIASRPPLRSTALPPAARTLRTHCPSLPSIDTRYRCPSTTATTTGSETSRPDLRPVTSKVTRVLEATPDEPTAAHTRFSILAIQLGRCPRYNQRLKQYNQRLKSV
jgi:hypothetical protein